MMAFRLGMRLAGPGSTTGGTKPEEAFVVDGEMALQLASVDAGYGKVEALHEVTVSIRPGEVVGIVGANGAGKSTIAKTVAGFVRPSRGRVVSHGTDVTELNVRQRVRRGISLVPEGGPAFRGLSVEENLLVGASATPSARSAPMLEKVLSTFPVLAERRRQDAGLLSGGERQMLAVGRALVAAPRLLVLDEPSIGLSPLMLNRLLIQVGELARNPSATDTDRMGVLLMEQNVIAACSVVDRIYVLHLGRIVHEATSPDPDEISEVILRSLGSV
jgi:branched-chain amino acid transport system ATP-binding protein